MQSIKYLPDNFFNFAIGQMISGKQSMKNFGCEKIEKINDKKTAWWKDKSVEKTDRVPSILRLVSFLKIVKVLGHWVLSGGKNTKTIITHGRLLGIVKRTSYVWW